MRKLIKPLLVLGLIYTLSGCSAFFDKDNTPEPKPLTSVKPEIQPHLRWNTSAGAGVGDEYLKSGPALGSSAIYTASVKGTVTSVSKADGHINWQANTGVRLMTTPGVGEGMVVVGSNRGDIVALREADGSILWKSSVPGEVLATPAVSNGRVVVKAVDGYVRALSAADGHTLWTFQQTEPALILRGSSAPVVTDNRIIAGFANGSLAKLTLNDGQLSWLQSIAIPTGIFSIQRMIDIDADPIVYDHRIYAATYQGKIASIDWASGRTLWSHDISSYTGMTADDNSTFVSDAKGYVWGFNAYSGLVNWRQMDLEYHNVTGPAGVGSYIVVGDSQGFLHWMSKHDGHFVARLSAGSAVYAAPVSEGNNVYVLTNKGNLLAYTLSA